MNLLWTANCKKCGKPSTVSPGKDQKLGEKIEIKCSHCGAVNEFHPSDLMASLVSDANA